MKIRDKLTIVSCIEFRQHGQPQHRKRLVKEELFDCI